MDRDVAYNSKWSRARKRFLAEHPLCLMCEAEGRIEAATVVDHIVPHKGDPLLFWNERNWQSLCKQHHDGAKRRAENRNTTSRVVGRDGRPEGWR